MSVNDQTLQSLYPDMVEWRRHLHRHPELSFREYDTSRMIADLLESWGLEVRRNLAGGTGVAAKLTGGLPGRTIALRADIDALPIADEKQTEYTSTVPGVMHACGHDAHTAQLLAVARYYTLHKEETAGTRIFLFQPGEEFLPGGAVGMIADGVLEGVDAVYGVHVWSPLAAGIVAARPGPFMACPDEFEVEIVGRGGHAGLPHQAADALVAGAALVTALQTIVARTVNPLDSAVVSVGKFQSGTANNVISERCRLSGTVRTFTPEVRALVRRRLEEIVRHTCEMHGTEFRFQYFEGYLPVVNDEAETQRVTAVASALLPQGHTQLSAPIMAGEDFSYYLAQKPGCFFLVGAGREDGMSAPHHHPRFDVDERAMLVAARILIGVADNSAAASALR